MKTFPVTTEAFFKKAVRVAECYGFSNIDDLRKEVQCKTGRRLGLQKHKGPKQQFEGHVLAEMFKLYTDAFGKKEKQPFMFYSPSIVSHPSTPSARVNALTLNTVGTNDPLAEVVLLKSAMSILNELGVKKYRLRINSIGDNDSTVRFLREASVQLKNKMDQLPPKVANAIRSNLGSTLAQLYFEQHPVAHDLPSPIEFLTTPSRKYFKEVLELLDHANVPFELADKLYADPSVYSHTIFEIVEVDETSDENAPTITLARGGRYDQLTKPYIRSSFPATAIVIAAKTKDRKSTIARPRKRKADACIVHIGREARLKSIEIIESFRDKRIPVEQCLYFERFSDQMNYAQTRKTKYIIIIGQQEARDGVALMRDTGSQSQRTIPIDQLPTVLKGA